MVMGIWQVRATRWLACNLGRANPLGFTRGGKRGFSYVKLDYLDVLKEAARCRALCVVDR
jgi:hypothetical protein